MELPDTRTGPAGHPQPDPRPAPAASPLSPIGSAAVSYVTWWKWPLIVGAAVPVHRHGRGLGVEDGVVEATTCPARVRRWWSRWPRAGIVAQTGQRFDVVIIPADAGSAVLDRLTARGAWLCPALADHDTVTFMVQPGQHPAWATLLAGLGTGCAHRGDRQLVLLPPGRSDQEPVRWVVPPTPANVPHLPGFEDLGGLIAAAARRSARRPGSTR